MDKVAKKMQELGYEKEIWVSPGMEAYIKRSPNSPDYFVCTTTNIELPTSLDDTVLVGIFNDDTDYVGGYLPYYEGKLSDFTGKRNLNPVTWEN